MSSQAGVVAPLQFTASWCRYAGIFFGQIMTTAWFLTKDRMGHTHFDEFSVKRRDQEIFVFSAENCFQTLELVKMLTQC